MTVLIALHALAATACLLPGARATRWAFSLAAAAPVIGLVWILATGPGVLDGKVRVESFRWVPGLDLTLQFRLDGWAWMMGLLVFGIGALVLAYCRCYFRARDDLGRIAGLLVAFAGAMWGLVCSDGLFTLFLFWELTSVTSFLLIGTEDRSAAARAAATRAFLVTGAGGLAMLAGLLLLSLGTGDTTVSALVADPPGGTSTSVALALVLVGALAKSAQFPLHFWLPGAMAAPTPISAYLHSATMVKAGLVIVARLAPAFAEAPPWRPMVVTAGAISLVLGGIRALRQQDAKLALAHGTVSQLGLLMLLLGLGTPATTYAGVALLAAHALFKAAMFLGVGVVDHEAGTRDIRRLRGLRRALPVTAAALICAGASMAAVPPTFGFVAKEKGLDALLHGDAAPWAAISLVAVVAGSALTVAYTARLLWGLLGDRAPGTAEAGPIDVGSVHRPAAAFVGAPVLLALLSVLFGLLAGPVGDVIGEVAASLDPASEAYHLVLWPGPNAALGLSVLTWVAGGALAVALVRAERDRDPSPGVATAAYDRAYDGLLLGSRRITAVTHTGSLPVYLAVVFLALVGGLLAALGAGRGGLGDIPLSSSWPEAVAATITATLAIGMLWARTRFATALLLGGAGYGLAVVFLAHGAPDLALTQFLVETVVIVLYLLVLVRLPASFGAPPQWAPRAARVALSLAVGAGLAGFAVATANARAGESVGDTFIRLAGPEGGGRNVVNVILVDFRGWDTLGEIAVLAVAAAGVVNLAQVAGREMRRRGLFPSAPSQVRHTVSGHVAGHPVSSGRSEILSTSARGIVAVLLLLSVFVTFRGHNAPGGGFAGGLIAAVAVALRSLADGPDVLRRLRIDPVALMGGGLLLAVAVATWPLLDGGVVLDSSIATVTVPVIGTVKVVSSTLFDIGVFLLVLGSVIGALRALSRADEEVGTAVDAEPAAPVDPAGAAEASASTGSAQR
jgi:multicomponent Na+:H+ antiporter subunit A